MPTRSAWWFAVGTAPAEKDPSNSGQCAICRAPTARTVTLARGSLRLRVWLCGSTCEAAYRHVKGLDR
jgi:hypothetical protein